MNYIIYIQLEILIRIIKYRSWLHECFNKHCFPKCTHTHTHTHTHTYTHMYIHIYIYIYIYIYILLNNSPAPSSVHDCTTESKNLKYIPKEKKAAARTRARIHTHTHTNIYIYIDRDRVRERERERERETISHYNTIEYGQDFTKFHLLSQNYVEGFQLVLTMIIKPTFLTASNLFPSMHNTSPFLSFFLFFFLSSSHYFFLPSLSTYTNGCLIDAMFPLNLFENVRLYDVIFFGYFSESFLYSFKPIF